MYYVDETNPICELIIKLDDATQFSIFRNTGYQVLPYQLIYQSLVKMIQIRLRKRATWLARALLQNDDHWDAVLSVENSDVDRQIMIFDFSDGEAIGSIVIEEHYCRAETQTQVRKMSLSDFLHFAESMEWAPEDAYILNDCLAGGSADFV